MAAAMIAGSSAYGTAISSVATFNIAVTGFPAPVGQNPPIPGVVELNYALDGRSVTNTVGPSGVVGSEVRTVGAVLFNQVTITQSGGIQINPVRDPNDPNRSIVAIFGLKGTVIDVSGSAATASFTVGRIGYFSIPNFTFGQNDPESWGFNLANEIGRYDLVAPDNVVPGLAPADQFAPIPASDVNISSVNAAIGTLTQGTFLALETGAGTFQTNTFPSGLSEGQVFVVNQQVQLPNLDLNNNNPAFPGTDQDVLNAIANYAFGVNFANFGSGNNTDYRPFNGVTGELGDFQASVGVQSNPIAQLAVPEPATAALGLMGLAGLALRRRRNA
jgi:MYXO-CTERM domain-containing protein